MYNSDNIEMSSVGIVSEPHSAWGGSWTEQKLNAFAKYVAAYLNIMNKYRDRYRWKLIYFDGFAGSGTRGESSNSSDGTRSLFGADGIDINSNEYNIYVGAAERVVQLDVRGFDFYYFNERDESSKQSLKSKLSKYEKSGTTFEFRSNDANEELVKLSRALSSKEYKALALLDPFGMQLNWSSIESLKGCGADVWILVPTGVIINRLLDGKGQLLFSHKLQDFFGMDEASIRDFFYERVTEQTLFGEETKYQKLPNTIHRIAELYISKLSDIFEHVTKEPLVLYNTRNVPIFHFVFASNNKTAVKIASDIVGNIK